MVAPQSFSLQDERRVLLENYKYFVKQADSLPSTYRTRHWQRNQPTPVATVFPAYPQSGSLAPLEVQQYDQNNADWYNSHIEELEAATNERSRIGKWKGIKSLGAG